jgi:small subunit ribosomal protein S16
LAEAGRIAVVKTPGLHLGVYSMVKIRLSRKGKRNAPFYHIVAVDENKKRDGAVLAKIGTYDPAVKEAKEKVKYNAELYQSWISKGARPTETVVQIVKSSSN